MPSAEKQKERCTRGQRLKLAALLVEHNASFGVMSKEAANFWIREPGVAAIIAADALEVAYDRRVEEG